MPEQSYVIRCPAVHNDKIAVIKAIRTLTNMGLKEAKDVSECTSEQVIKITPSYGVVFTQESIDVQLQILKNNGVTIVNSVLMLLDSLRELGAQALKQGEDELANEILQLVLAEKLRRK